jgi:hypothetical protein
MVMLHKGTTHHGQDSSSDTVIELQICFPSLEKLYIKEMTLPQNINYTRFV